MTDKYRLDHPDPNIWWRYRRRLAFTSLFFGFFITIMFTIVALYNSSAIASLGAVVGWAYGMVTFVIGGYLTNTTVEDYMRYKK